MVTGCSSCVVDNYSAMTFDNGGIGSFAAISFQNITASTFTNFGSITIGLSINGGGGIALGMFSPTFDNHGAIDIMTTGSSKPGINQGFFPANFNNHSSGVLTFYAGLDGTAPIGGFNMNLMNDGTIDIDKSGSVDVVLSGSGTFGGTETFINLNNIAPGNSPGCITFASGLTHSGSTSIELGGTVACTNHDKVSVGGTATISGGLTVTLINGFTPTAGQTFTLLEAGAISGTYSTINYPTVSGITWTTTYNATSVVANANATLPVELVRFDAQTFDKEITLQWQTASETNNAGFFVERSTNTRSWETIGFVEGRGDFSEMQSYTLLDKTPIPGVNYYRLRQVDFDGVFEYSNTTSANISFDIDIHVFPNPTSDILQIKGEEFLDTPIRILNQSGCTVYQDVFRGDVIDVSYLDAGIYLLEIQEEAKSIHKRFVINR